MNPNYINSILLQIFEMEDNTLFFVKNSLSRYFMSLIETNRNFYVQWKISFEKRILNEISDKSQFPYTPKEAEEMIKRSLTDSYYELLDSLLLQKVCSLSLSIFQKVIYSMIENPLLKIVIPPLVEKINLNFLHIKIPTALDPHLFDYTIHSESIIKQKFYHVLENVFLEFIQNVKKLWK